MAASLPVFSPMRRTSLYRTREMQNCSRKAAVTGQLEFDIHLVYNGSVPDGGSS
jgi:hypothetical protein